MTFSARGISHPSGHGMPSPRICVFLVAADPGLGQPPMYGDHSFQSMRPVAIPPHQPVPFKEPDERIVRLPHLSVDGLGGMHVPSRPIRGTILRDDSGRLYEQVGSSIRRLHNLATALDGNIYELPPSAEIWDSAQEENQASLRRHRDQQPVEEEADPFLSTEQDHATVTLSPGRTPHPLLRKLFKGAGQWRVLPWSNFRDVLSAQLAHPERLRDSHRVGCFLQLYEAQTGAAPECVPRSAPGGRSGEIRLYPLTETAAAKLQLKPPPRMHSPRPGRAPRVQKEILFSLDMPQDPTADTPMAPLSPAAQLAPPVRKGAIPDRFLSPWEFKLSRDEAIYDMHADAPPSGIWQALKHRLSHRIAKAELQKWQTLLHGKAPDDQLWVVRPPKHGVSHPQIRDWAHATLGSAGYDADNMLAEWEIYWRRKGINQTS